MNRKLVLLVSLIAVFGTVSAVAIAASSPAVATGSAASVTSSSAVLRGSVNPNGAKTGYEFQWGLTTAYGSRSTVKTLAAGSKPVPVSLKVRRLLPGTVYHYRLVAFNHVGGAIGADRTFKTKGNPPPYAATGPASEVSSNSATVTGVVNPNGQKTTWYFQYGLSSSYSSQTLSHTVPAGSSPVTVSQQLAGLSPGTIFHYRIVAINRGVVERGNDAIFMTFPSHPPTPRVRAKTRPRHDSRRPFVFTTSGRIGNPSSIPSQFACSGQVKVRFFVAKRRVAKRFAPVQPNCTFSTQTMFRHRPGRRHGSQTQLRVLIQYLGNGYLARNRARVEHVTLG